MASTGIWLGESEENLRFLDLEEQNTFTWQKALTEYSQQITICVRTDSGVILETPRGRECPSRTDRSGRQYYCLSLKQKYKGIVGFRSVDLTFTINNQKYSLRIKFPLDPENLTKEQFTQMLDDISYWVFSALASPIEMDVALTSQPTEIILPQEPVLNLISEHIDEIERTVNSISATPRKHIQRQYFVSRCEQGKHDAVTMRWTLLSPDESVYLVPRNVTSYDVYENRFVLFFLDLLIRRLSFIQRQAETTRRKREEEKEQKQRYGNNNAVQTCERERQKAEEIINRCKELIERLQRLQRLEFLRDVHFDARQSYLHVSLGLTQDFHYGHLFDLHRKINQNNGIKRLDRLRNFKEGLDSYVEASIGMERTSKIYEYWIFFAVCQELRTQFHFRLRSEEELIQAIDQESLTPRIRPGACVTLIGDPNIYKNVCEEIRVYYEREFGTGKDGRPLACPDITIEIKKGKSIRRLILDAKYKDYTGDVANDFSEDLETVKTKYQAPSQRKGGAIPESIGAFLLHTTTIDKHFENYGACVVENGKWEANAHRCGFVPVVPGYLTPLRTLLVMLFLVKLGADVAMCWVCGSTDVKKQPYHDQSGALKENRWVCQRCGHEWWMNRCKCGFPLPKGKFSFILQHRDVEPDSSCTGYFCPRCGECACGAKIQDIPQAKPPAASQSGVKRP